MIRLRDIHKEYPNGTKALKGVSMQIDDGDFVFLVGPSGSGKSTIIKLITAEIAPTKGKLMVNGYNLNDISEKQIPLLRRTIGVVFQDFRLIEKKTVFENIEVAMRAVGATTSEIRRRIRATWTRPGLWRSCRCWKRSTTWAPPSWWSPTSESWSTASASAWWPSRAAASSATRQGGITAMGDRQIWYHIREGFRSIFTHGLMSFAAVCMTVACLLIMGSFSLIAVNANHVLGDLEKDNEFLAYIDDSLTREQGEALQSQIEAIPNVASATFVTKEQAWEDFKAQHDDKSYVFDESSPSTLRDRFVIHVNDIQLMSDTVTQVKEVSGIARVQASLEIADGFVMLRNVASAVAIILVVMLVIISISIIANTIKLSTFTRRDEIAIMKMCGATNWFVRWPFLVEGVILGVAGGIIAFFVQWGIYGLIVNAMAKSGILSIISTVPFASMSHLVLLVFLGAGFAIGAGGSAMAIQKFLKV